jgi:CBS domain-containing protein
VTRAIEPESIDTYSLAREGKTLHIGKDRQLLMQIPVSAAMNPNPDVVASNETFTEVLRKATQSSQGNLPVIGPEGRFFGLVIIRELLALVTSSEDPARIGKAADVCDTNSPTLAPNANLDQALRLMESEGVEELAVTTAANQHLVGLLSRSAVRSALNRATASIVSVVRSDAPITWSDQYQVAQIRVGAGASGKSIRQLDPRMRFGVNIVGMQQAYPGAAGFGPPDPDRVLRLGDLLLAAGSPSSVRSFRREITGR